MELYQVKTIITASCKIEQIIQVFAESLTQAKKEATKVAQDLGPGKVKRAIYLGTDIKVVNTRCFPTLIAPVKGNRRSALTRTQKDTLKKMIKNGEKTQLRFTPSGGWQITGPVEPGSTWGTGVVDSKTVVALRQKNLIIPLPMDDTERRVQQAIGTYEVGEFRFILNMKEVRKRKVYQDHVQTV